jgi:hypothetical protein
MPTDINIQVIDSRDDSRYTYFVADDCHFKALKAKIGDLCYIMRIVENECHIKLDVANCEEKK